MIRVRLKIDHPCFSDRGIVKDMEMTLISAGVRMCPFLGELPDQSLKMDDGSIHESLHFRQGLGSGWLTTAFEKL